MGRRSTSRTRPRPGPVRYGPINRSSDVIIATGKVAFLDTNGNAVLLGGVVSGNGGFIKQGNGTLTLSNGSNSHANNRIDGGVLEINDNAQLGNVAGTLFFNGGTLRTSAGTTSNRPVALQSTGTFNTNGFDSTWNGQFTGAGSFTKAGAGVLTLTNSSSNYSGGTTITGGRLVAGNANALGTGAVVVNGGTLEIATGVMFGNTVNLGSGGSLADNGTLTSTLTVPAGGALGGTGTVGGVNVQSGGSVAPGNSPGTLTVIGNADFAPNSTFSVQVTGTAGDNDTTRSRLFSAAGTLTFAGSAGNLFTFNVTKFGAGIDVNSSYTVAQFSAIGSAGLDTPLQVVTNMSGSGSATNGSFIQLSVSGFSSGMTFSLQRIGSSLILNTIAPVPEPAAVLAVMLAGAGVWGWRRRK